MTIQDVQMSAERWRMFWSSFKGEPQQLAGIEELRQHIAQSDPALLTESASWVCNFHKEQPQAQQQTIPVPYFCQLNMDDGSGWRDCFSTTCAMIAAWKGQADRFAGPGHPGGHGNPSPRDGQ